MKLNFQVVSETGEQSLDVDFRNLVVAGWAGRDIAAIEHHIEELAAIGVPRPSSVPLYYRIAANQLVSQSVHEGIFTCAGADDHYFLGAVLPGGRNARLVYEAMLLPTSAGPRGRRSGCLGFCWAQQQRRLQLACGSKSRLSGTASKVSAPASRAATSRA